MKKIGSLLWFLIAAGLLLPRLLSSDGHVPRWVEVSLSIAIFVFFVVTVLGYLGLRRRNKEHQDDEADGPKK